MKPRRKRTPISFSHAGGNKKEEYNYLDGVLDGFQFEWYVNGQISSESTFLKGGLVGNPKKWTSDGKLSKERIIYFNSGKISEKRTDNGENISYYSNGKITWIGNYRNGKRHGIFRYYDYYGDRKYIEKYDNGKLIYKK